MFPVRINVNKEVALGTSKIVSLPTEGRPRLTKAELHRPASDGSVQQEVQRAYREVLLQDTAREVRLGHQERRRDVGVLGGM